MRARRQAAVLRCRMGSQHTFLPRPTGYRPSGLIAVSMERTVRFERIPVFDAFTRGPVTSGCRATRVAHGGRPSGSLYGSHQDIPRAGGKAEGVARRFGRIQLPQSHRLVHYRRLRSVGRSAHRVFAGEVTVRPRGVLSDAVSEPADKIRQTAVTAAVPTDGQQSSDRAAIFCTFSGENANRNADQGHAVERQQLQLAVHELDVTQCVAPARLNIVGTQRMLLSGTSFSRRRANSSYKF